MRPVVLEHLAPLVGDRLAAYLVPKGTTILLAAIVVVLWVMVRRGRRIGLPARTIVTAAAVGVLAGLIGARAFFLLQHLPRVADHPAMLTSLCGGTTSWGAYLGGLLGFAGYLRWRRRPVLPHLDLLASCLGLGPAIARWACLMSGCCWGASGHGPGLIRFPRGSFAHAAHVADGRLDSAAALSLPVYPVQVYASLAGALVFVIVSGIWRRERRRPGLTFAAYWVVYGTFRFATEFFRGDVARHGPLALTQSQIVALILAAAGLAAASRFLRRDRPAPA